MSDNPQQKSLFDRDCGMPTIGRMGDRHYFASTTWWLRDAYAADFKVRAACLHLEFTVRRIWNVRDEDGDYLQYVFECKRDEDGNLNKDKDGRVIQYHVRGPDGKHLTRKRGKVGNYVRMYEPRWPIFPSHEFATFNDDYEVTGDDGTTWKVGSRGNGLDILRQEILNNRVLWPEEKTKILAWLDGDRKIPDRHVEDPQHLHMKVDKYFCDRIQEGLPVTDDEIRESGLPDETVENLIYNLHHCRVDGP